MKQKESTERNGKPSQGGYGGIDLLKTGTALFDLTKEIATNKARKSPHSLTTLQEKMRDSFDEKFLCDDRTLNKYEGEGIKDFISQAISTAYNQGVKDGGEEVIGDPADNYIAWREYVNGEYEKGRKDKKSRVILAYQEWLYDEQNRRLKKLLIHINKYEETEVRMVS